MRYINGNVERITESEAMAAKLKALGFKAMDFPSDKEVENDVTDIEKMTVANLKAVAKKKGIEGAGSLNKEELLAVLKDVI